MKNILSASKNEERFLFVINTPGQAYTWRYLIQELLDKHYQIRILARDVGLTTSILKAFDLKHDTFKSKGSKVSRLFGTLNHLQAVYKLAKLYNPKVVFGFGIDAAITAARLHVPSILFIDDDHARIQNKAAHLFAKVIFTPQCFLRNLGKKQIRLPGYKELAYLYPGRFIPDPGIFNELNISNGEKYAIVRFNSFEAVHDIGLSMIPDNQKIELVKKLSNHIKVFVSPEGKIPPELKYYQIPIPSHRIHHALYYAQVFLSDTGTMCTEAAVLGTPAIRCTDKKGRVGNFWELENKYGLLYRCDGFSKAVDHAIVLLREPGLKEAWAKKRKAMLDEKIDITKYLIGYIENHLTCKNNKS